MASPYGSPEARRPEQRALEDQRADTPPEQDWKALRVAREKCRADNIAETAAELRQIYDSGTAFFTKDSIRDLASQLQVINSKLKEQGPCDEKGEVLIPQVNGRKVHAPVLMSPPSLPAAARSDASSEPGQDEEEEEEEDDSTESGCAAPRDSEETIVHHIRYRSYQALLADGDTGALGIAFEFRRRDRATGELVPSRASLPLEDVRRRLAAEMRAWAAAGCCRQLRANLRAAAPRMPAVTKIIAFAMGTISRRGHHGCTRSLRQHALVLTIRSILNEESRGGDSGAAAGRELACFAQDPDYSEVDRAVLREHGITVLEDPQAFLDVDEESVVLSFAPNVPVKQIVADIARPAMIVWEPAGSAEKFKHQCMEWLRRTQVDGLPTTPEEYEART